jgi:hypothetical protein
MKKDLFWTMIAIGLIMLVGTLVLGGISSVPNLTGTAEHWQFLMRQLRR